MIYIGGTGFACGDGFPVMTVVELVDLMGRLDDFGMRDLAGSDPACGELTECAVDVVGVEKNATYMLDPSCVTSVSAKRLDGDWPIGLFDVAEPYRG